MHIIIDPEFGRNHPLWSQNDNGTDIHIYPFSEDLIERILKWTKYWDDNYLYSRKIGDAFVQGWIPEADVNGWVNEGIRITEKMKEELPSLTVEKKIYELQGQKRRLTTDEPLINIITIAPFRHSTTPSPQLLSTSPLLMTLLLGTR